MPKAELKLEESFLAKALEGGVPLRLTLSNRERLNGILLSVGRYDLNLDSDGRVVTLSKKEISHITPAQTLLDESFFKETPAPEAEVSTRSRVQDEFLDRYVREKTLALFRMRGGDEIRGVAQGYDGFTLSVKTGRGEALIYKHGLCCIGPGYRRDKGKDDAR